eukprot:g32156.t1
MIRDIEALVKKKKEAYVRFRQLEDVNLLRSIELYKCTVGESKTREQRLKVRGERFKRDPRGNFVTQRTVRVWNELPEEVVDA